MDERFAEEDMSEILNTDEIARFKTSTAISPTLEFIFIPPIAET